MKSQLTGVMCLGVETKYEIWFFANNRENYAPRVLISDLPDLEAAQSWVDRQGGDYFGVMEIVETSINRQRVTPPGAEGA